MKIITPNEFCEKHPKALNSVKSWIKTQPTMDAVWENSSYEMLIYIAQRSLSTMELRKFAVFCAKRNINLANEKLKTDIYDFSENNNKILEISERDSIGKSSWKELKDIRGASEMPLVPGLPSYHQLETFILSGNYKGCMKQAKTLAWGAVMTSAIKLPSSRYEQAEYYYTASIVKKPHDSESLRKYLYPEKYGAPSLLADAGPRWTASATFSVYAKAMEAISIAKSKQENWISRTIFGNKSPIPEYRIIFALKDIADKAIKEEQEKQSDWLRKNTKPYYQ